MNRDILCDLGYEDSIIFENPDYDDAIIGIDDDGRVVYDYELMLFHLVKQEKMSMTEAIDFIDYNTIASLHYMGEKAPIIMYPIN